MKWKLVLVLLAALAAGGVLLASQQERQPESDTQEEPSDFVPTEKIPAGGAISFPVDI